VRCEIIISRKQNLKLTKISNKKEGYKATNTKQEAKAVSSCEAGFSRMKKMNNSDIFPVSRE
jgi:hypothetical protein